jgi:Ca2+-binding RTX toxin-like protein/dipeptidyl aminopeptidase/acylaminoacyl peptidase
MAITLPASAQAIRPLSQEDVFRLEAAADPQIAPDGGMVAYVRRSNDITTDRTRSAIWVVNADGSGHRQLLPGEGETGSPRWSPDGAQLAYVRTQDETTTLEVLTLADGAARTLTTLPAGQSGLAWSPDGTQLAWAAFRPSAGPAAADLPERTEDMDWAAGAQVEERLSFRFDGAGELPMGRQQLFVIDLAGGEPRQLTDDEAGAGGDFAWSADGSALYFSADRRPDNGALAPDSELHRVDLATGAIETLTGRTGPDTTPRPSPDGTQLAWLGYDDHRMGYHNVELYVAGPDGAEPRSVTAELDRSVSAPQWSADGRMIYFLYDDSGQTRLARTNLEGHIEIGLDDLTPPTFGRPYTGGSFSVSVNGRVAATVGSSIRPPEVILMSPLGDTSVLTSLNEDVLAEIDLTPAEEIHWASPHDGLDIEGWALYPPGFDPAREWPMILEIHGGPFSAYGPTFSAELRLMAAAGYVVVYTNPRGSTSYGYDFANLIHHDYPGHDYDDLMGAVDHMIGRGFIDEDRLFVTGGSGGDYLAGDSGVNVLTGNGGNDILFGGSGDDVAAYAGAIGDFNLGFSDDGAFVFVADQSGSEGSDTVSNDVEQFDFAGEVFSIQGGTAAGDTLSGTAGRDFIVGLAGQDSITGEAGDDLLAGGVGNDTLAGGTGNDTLQGSDGDDSLIGGDGLDTADFSDAGGAVNVDLNAGTASGDGTDTLSGIENIVGGAQADTLTGDAQANAIEGGVGGDSITGGAGNDSLSGDAGGDTLFGGLGDDSFDGGIGFDSADYRDSATPVNVDMSAGGGSGTVTGEGADTLTSIERVFGSAGNDTFTGSDGNDNFVGRGGDDLLIASLGNDTLNGAAGNDTADFSNLTGAFQIDLTGNSATLDANSYTVLGLETIIGTAGDDTMTGDADNNRLEGGQGADSINGGGGADTLLGGAGNDTIAGGDGNDSINGGAGNDSLDGGAGNDTLDFSDATEGVAVDLIGGLAASTATGTDTVTGFNGVTGGAGDDSIRGSADADTIVGGEGDDLIIGEGGNDSLDGGAGSNTLSFATASADLIVDMTAGTAAGAETGSDGFANFTTVIGGAGADFISGDAERNFLLGGAGNDTLNGGGERDTLRGGAGDDVLNGSDAEVDVADYSDATEDLTLALGAVTDISTTVTTNDLGTDTLFSIDGFIGGTGNDSITGNAGINRLGGGDGNDTLIGGDGADVMFGDAGNDSVEGGNGDDFIFGGIGDDTIDGGADDLGVAVDSIGDVISYFGLGTGVDIDLAAGTAIGADAGTDVVTNFEAAVGTDQGDTLSGNASNNLLQGRLGDDSISGLDGDDDIFGDEGDDVVEGGAGADTLRGDFGNDTIDGGDGDDLIQADQDDDTVSGGAGNDQIFAGSGDDSVLGDDGNDAIEGGAGSDSLFGGLGDDTLTETSGQNLMDGGAGNDSITGADNLDTLRGGEGADTLTGGGGADAFQYDQAIEHQDVITDFTSGEDRFLIDRDAFGINDGGSGTLTDGESFVRVAEALIDGDTELGTGQATFVFDSNNTLHFDPDGDGAQASFEIASVTVSNGTLQASDFEIQ